MIVEIIGDIQDFFYTYAPTGIALAALAEGIFLGYLLIEVTQWVTKTGCFELDDVLTNTLGMLLGCVVCIVVRRDKSKRYSNVSA